MSNRKFFRPKEIEQVFGIKTSTLAKQRGENTACPTRLLDVIQRKIEAV